MIGVLCGWSRVVGLFSGGLRRCILLVFDFAEDGYADDKGRHYDDNDSSSIHYLLRWLLFDYLESDGLLLLEMLFFDLFLWFGMKGSFLFICSFLFLLDLMLLKLFDLLLEMFDDIQFRFLVHIKLYLL